MSLVERVRQMIIDKRLLQPGDRLVAAVSAGPDSVCLLRVLHQLSAEFAWSLIVAHLNHGFRGAAASADAAFVQRLSEQLGLPVRQHSVDIPDLLAKHGGSSQDVSRQERYRWLRQVAAAEQAQAIALAHHRGDQAETVLQHLLRGAGSSGLAGMRPREEGDPCALVRPLLLEGRQEIMHYLQCTGQSFRVDQSNAEDHYQRNYLRWEVLPRLSQSNGQIEQALSRTASLLQAEDQLLGDLAREAYDSIRLTDSPVLTLDLALLRQMPLALVRRVLRLAWSEIAGGERDLDYDHVEGALELLQQSGGAGCNWPRGVTCRLSYQQLLIISPEFTAGAFCLPLNLPGVAVLPHGLGEIRSAVLDYQGQPLDYRDPNRVYCDYLALTEHQLLVRNWLPGDEFRPFGLPGSKKLQDYFVDAKVPRHLRGRVPLVVVGGQVVWVAGMRLAEPFRISACSRKVVCLEYRHSDD